MDDLSLWHEQTCSDNNCCLFCCNAADVWTRKQYHQPHLWRELWRAGHEETGPQQLQVSDDDEGHGKKWLFISQAECWMFSCCLDFSGKKRRPGSKRSMWRRSSWRRWWRVRFWSTAGENLSADGTLGNAGDITAPPPSPKHTGGTDRIQAVHLQQPFPQVIDTNCLYYWLFKKVPWLYHVFWMIKCLIIPWYCVKCLGVHTMVHEYGNHSVS